jgi:hypothetical protein
VRARSERAAEGDVTDRSDALNQHLHLRRGWDLFAIGRVVERPAREEPGRHAPQILFSAMYEPACGTVPATRTECASDDRRVKITHHQRVLQRQDVDLEALFA